MLGTQQTAHISSISSIQRPRERRSSLRLGCCVRPVSADNVALPGTVMHISRSGVLVALDAAPLSWTPRPYDMVRVVVDLPRHPLFSPRCLECFARVVRIDDAEAQTQVAFEITRMHVTDQRTKVDLATWRAPAEGSVQ